MIAKKFLFMLMGIAITVSLFSCESNQYKARGEKLAKQLDEQVELQDTAAVLATDQAIHDAEQEILALNDSAAIADFQAALKETRQRHIAYITSLKVKNGQNSDDAVKDVVNDVMNGDMDINAVTNAIDKVLEEKADSKPAKVAAKQQ